MVDVGVRLLAGVVGYNRCPEDLNLLVLKQGGVHGH
jgi:hypothetical protein